MLYTQNASITINKCSSLQEITPLKNQMKKPKNELPRKIKYWKLWRRMHGCLKRINNDILRAKKLGTKTINYH